MTKCKKIITSLLLPIFAILILVTSCGPKPGTLEYTLKQERKIQKQKEKIVKKSIKAAPRWYLKLPKDKKYYYGSGTGKSRDIQFSKDKAKLHAAAELGRIIELGIISTMESVRTEIETSIVDQSTYKNEVKSVTKAVIDNVKLRGWDVKKEKMTPESDQFRTFVLLRYSKAKADKFLYDRIQESKIKNLLNKSTTVESLDKDVEG